MKKSLYCVRDDIAEVFQPPFTSINDATAKRDFINGVAQQPVKNDLTLYYLGEYCDNSGVITMDKTPRRIMSGFEVHNPSSDALVDDEPFESPEYR